MSRRLLAFSYCGSSYMSTGDKGSYHVWEACERFRLVLFPTHNVGPVVLDAFDTRREAEQAAQAHEDKE